MYTSCVPDIVKIVVPINRGGDLRGFSRMYARKYVPLVMLSERLILITLDFIIPRDKVRLGYFVRL